MKPQIFLQAKLSTLKLINLLPSWSEKSSELRKRKIWKLKQMRKFIGKLCKNQENNGQVLSEK